MTESSEINRGEQLVDTLVLRGLKALPDLVAARQAADELAACSGDRAVFALCLLTLELALGGEQRARQELPTRVGVLLEAFRDPALASLLSAGNPELSKRWDRVRPVVGEFVSLQLAPPPPQSPAKMPRLATPVELIEEIQEIIEEPPAPHTPPPPPPPPAAVKVGGPPPPPVPSAAAKPPAKEPNEEVRSFWRFAEEALGRVPDPEHSVLGCVSFSCERSSDRERLVRFAHSAIARFPHCEPARALASLVLLFTASQQGKGRGLLGLKRKERLDVLRTGLALLGDPVAAGQAAVLFENDGPETRRHFADLVDLVQGFLGFCAHEGLDPSKPETHARYCSQL
jgi:hypothetical protein